MRKITIASIVLILAIRFYNAQAWAEAILLIGEKISYATTSWYGAAFHGKEFGFVLCSGKSD